MTRVLWVHNSDHVFSMWTIGTDGSIASTAAAVPSAGYVPVSLAMDGYGVGRVLMSDSLGDSQIEDLLPDNATSGILMTLPVGHIAGTGLTAGYTGDGLRAWKQTDAGARTYYLYDGSDPIAELDASGTIQAVNTFGAQGLVSRHTTATNASVFYTFDERGNVAQRLDSTGSALSADLYDAFGARTGTAAPNDPWGFGAQWGYQSDAETGLVLCTNRYYDPQQGRFLTRDPVSYNGGINLYSYTANNPVNEDDPDGYAKVEIRYRRVLWPGFHAFILVTDLNGKQYEIAGGPDSDGKLYVRSGPYQRGSYDWPGASGSKDTETSRPKPTTLINDNKTASYYMCHFRLAGQLINGSDITYLPLGDNSNATVREVLTNSNTGLKPPRKRPVWTPGWYNTLPINVHNWH